jgi:hypothetical protein
MQLVGLACLRCNERITSIHDGVGCDECGAPVHRRCVTPGAASRDRCAACGSARTDIQAHTDRVTADHQTQTTEIRSYHLGHCLLSLLLGSVLLTLSILLTIGSIEIAKQSGGGSFKYFRYGAAIAGLALIVKSASHARAYFRERRKS